MHSHINQWETLLTENQTYCHKDYPSGCYVGTVDADGFPSGQGVFLFANGDLYLGQWLDGQMHGNGKILYNFSGAYEIYEGEWLFGKKHGKGQYKQYNTFLRKQETIYQGRFNLDNFEGQGSVNFGSFILEGQFSSGFPDGKTRLFIEDNLTAEMECSNGIMENVKLIERRQRRLERILITTEMCQHQNSQCTK